VTAWDEIDPLLQDDTESAQDLPLISDSHQWQQVALVDSISSDLDSHAAAQDIVAREIAAPVELPGPASAPSIAVGIAGMFVLRRRQAR